MVDYIFGYLIFNYIIHNLFMCAIYLFLTHERDRTILWLYLNINRNFEKVAEIMKKILFLENIILFFLFLEKSFI